MKYSLPVFFLLFSICGFSQDMDSLFTKIPAYGRTVQPALLFLQTDRHIYLNNEFIWFSGYIIQENDTSQQHQFLAVFLVAGDTRKVVLQQKFVMTNGLAYGSIRLPDSIPLGQYKLVACTNVLKKDGMPAAIFEQDINIHSVTDPSFTAAMITGANQQLMITVRDKASSMPVKAASIETWMGAHPAVKGATDQNGIYYQSLKAIGYDSTRSDVIRVKIKFGNEYMFLQKIMDTRKPLPGVQVRCYPEGGYLVGNLPCRMGIEVKSSDGAPLPARVVLYKNEMPVDSLRTGVEGLGLLSLVPDLHAHYTIKVTEGPPGISLPGQGFPLPTVFAKGMIIHLPVAITADTARFEIYSSGYTQVKMLVHNFQQVFELDSFSAGSGMRNIVLLLDKLPRGIAAITLLDENNHPIADRLFFAHYDKKIAVAIIPDKKVLGKRDKLTVHFKLPPGLPAHAAFASVACAQSSRFSNSMQQDIESFTMVKQVLQDMPATAAVSWFNQKDFLEKLLLVEEWRNAGWNDFYKLDTARLRTYSPVIYADIMDNRKYKKDAVVMLVGENAARVDADEYGRAVLAYDKLYVSQDRELIVSASVRNTTNLQVKITDPFETLGDSVAARTRFRKTSQAGFSEYAQSLELGDLMKQKVLKNVTVVAKPEQDLHFIGVSRVNECGDYVCSYDILNCANHVNAINNTEPVVGRMYTINGMRSVYRGCQLTSKTNRTQTYDGIKLGKEFYPEDFSKNSSPFPENLVTLYWSPGLYFDKDGNASCSFYTGDITGKFRIVINGTTGDDVFSASEVIEVR